MAASPHAAAAYSAVAPLPAEQVVATTSAGMSKHGQSHWLRYNQKILKDGYGQTDVGTDGWA
eukprot:scaffold78102_cov18-Tisochrysis_lutea.AAC.1